MRELRIGDRVRTPAGVGVVMRPIGREGQPPLGYCVGYAEREFWLDHDAASVEPLPPDIPRERVADLHAAVAKRVAQLADEMSHEGHESDDVHGYPHPRICLTCTRDEDHEVQFYVREGADAEAARSAHAELSEVAEALRLLLGVDDGE